MDFTSNIGLHMPFSVSQPESLSIVLWFLFGLFILFFLIISAILMYHWGRYGMGSRTVAGARIVYLAVSAAILVLAGVLLGAL